MTAVVDPPLPKKGPSLVIQGAVLLVLTLVVAGGGWFAGSSLQHPPAPEEPAAAKEAAAGGHGAPSGGHGAPEEAKATDAALHLVDLPPITTNLAQPAETWLRLELSLLFDQTPEPGMAEAVHQDLLAYVRTVKLHQVEGASGFQHLKADLLERANIRSGGHVKDAVIRTMLFE